MNLNRTVQPTSEALSLKEVKDFLNVTNTAQDQIIVSLIYAATELVEKYLNRALITQTYSYSIDRYPPCDKLKLMYGPVQSITSITSTLTDASTEVFSSDNYYLANADTDPAISLNYNAIWPSYVLQPTQGVTIVYVTGYGDTADDVPQGIKSSMMALIANLFENREDEMVELPQLIKTMLHQYKSYTWL